MMEIDVHNCNNVVSANIKLLENNLNIRYAINGTGKSTIAKAMDLFSKNENLSALKPFDGDNEPKCTISGTSNKVLLFDEDFVDKFVFKESEVIQNAYEVFIRTPESEERQKAINEKLKNIHIDVNQNAELQNLISTGKSVMAKFALTRAGELKQTGLIKSLTSSESIFILPQGIKKFQPFMEKEYNVDWVGWKNEGSNYDDNKICPFCTTSLDDGYESEKELFNSSYTKSNVRNIKEMLSYFDAVSDFMNEDKRKILYQCIKETKDEAAITLWVKRFYNDLKFLVEKISMVLEFNSFQVESSEISGLADQLANMKIHISDLDIFDNKRTKDLIDYINSEIDSVLDEVEILKSEIGRLKGLLESSKKRAIADINEFLFTAGINYEFEILQVSESVTKTILRYKSSKKSDPIEVNNIKLHLSWGERNAFALILFMHYAISQGPEIIVLDDPISSFDNNKKYAIINRLFNTDSRKRSFYKKTVLLLTHDFQPIIDFVINGKPNHEFVSAYFLQNKEGVIYEREISKSDIKPLPIFLSDNSKCEGLNKVHRVTCLRKLLEHMPKDPNQNLAYSLLSCLLHGKETPSCKDGADLTQEEIICAEEFIKHYIVDFNYSDYSKNVFNKESLTNLFIEEKHPYFRLQVFRALLAVSDLRSKIKDDPLLKYIDEQFHVENDYIFYLDFMKYDIVPDFVMPKCLEFLRREHLIDSSVQC